MSARFAICLMGPALLGACGEEAPVASRSQDAAALARQKARIDALAPGQRDAVFLRAIRDGGEDCQQVVGSAYSGDQLGQPSWAARCSDGRDWIIVVEASGRALVAPRSEPTARR